jgi:hypothetical protein
MSVALILGRSDPLDCEMVILQESMDEVAFLAYDVAANSIQKCVEHACVSYGILPCFTLPSGKSGGVSSLSVIRHD